MAGRCTCSNWSLMMLQGWTDCLQCGNRILMGFGGVSQCSWLFLTILNRSAFLEASNSHRGALPLNSPGLIACRLLVNQFGYCIRTCLCSVFATKSSRANGDVRNIAQSWHKDTHTHSRHQTVHDGTGLTQHVWIQLHRRRQFARPWSSWKPRGCASLLWSDFIHRLM